MALSRLWAFDACCLCCVYRDHMGRKSHQGGCLCMHGRELSIGFTSAIITPVDWGHVETEGGRSQEWVWYIKYMRKEAMVLMSIKVWMLDKLSQPCHQFKRMAMHCSQVECFTIYMGLELSRGINWKTTWWANNTAAISQWQTAYCHRGHAMSCSDYVTTSRTNHDIF